MYNITKYFVVVVVFFLASQGGIAVAQETNKAELNALEVAETVTLKDLGVEKAGILPTSPFYFFKEWGRGVQSLLTFNKVKKAELEARITNEKAAELKAVEEQRPDDEKGIARALSNFAISQERLVAHLEKMQETSENPNVGKLLDKVAEKSILHEKLLENVKARNENKEMLRETVENVKTKLVRVVQSVMGLDTPEKSTDRLKNALENSLGSAFKDIRSIEFIDNVQDKLSEEVKMRLESVREGFRERLKEKIEINAKDGENLKAIFELIPGDETKRAGVLEEIRLKVSDKASSAIEKVQERLEEKVQDRANFVKPISPRPSEPDENVCTQEYDPVCGVNGKTYSNRCVAERQNNVKVAREGECEPSTTLPLLKIEPEEESAGGFTPEEMQRIEEKEESELQDQKVDTQTSRQQQLELELLQQFEQLNQLQEQLQKKQAE